MAGKQYSGTNTLKALINVIVNALAGKVNKTDIVNDLTTQSASVPLSAAQGKVLDEKIKAAEDKITAAEGKLESDLTGKIGQRNGIAPLDDSGLVSSDYLPSYVDDVIEGYYDPPTEEDEATAGKFYTDDKAEGSQTYDPEKLIEGERGKIYIDLHTNLSYRWSGTTYVAITAGNMTELTAEEIEEMWIAAGKAAEEEEDDDNA